MTTETVYKKLIETMELGVVLHDADGKIVQINPAAERILGISDQRARGLDSNTGDWRSFREDGTPFSGDEHPAMVALRTGETVTDVVMSIYNPISKERRWININAVPEFKPGMDKPFRIFVTFTDITRQKQTEQRCAQNERFLARIIDSIQDGLSVLAPDLTIRQVNSIMEKWYEKQLPLNGKKCFQCYHQKNEVCNPCPSIEALKTGKTETAVVPGPAGGEVEWVEIIAYPLRENDDDEITGVIEFVRDITERIKLEQIMIQSEKMLSVGELAAGVAHEINNPLAGIIQNAQVVEKRLFSEIQSNIAAAQKVGLDLSVMREYLAERNIFSCMENIQQSGLRAGKIVHDMLSFTRRNITTMQHCFIESLVEQAITLAGTGYDLSGDYDFKKIRIRREFDCALPQLECDPGKMVQVFLNLLGNAAAAITEKQKEETFEPEIQIKIVYEAEHQRLRIDVADNGCGMIESVRKKVFEPFFTTKEAGRGTGLGLSVSYFIVTRDHMGSMSVTSEPGRGSVFHVILPV